MSRVGGRSGEGYISPAVQREAIAAYASEMGGTVAEWFTDEDFSGGTTERPGFQAALASGLDGIVVMRIDRFARSVADGARIVRELTDAGQVFASCHERIDPRTPEGRFMLTSFLANAELFLDQMKAGWETSKGKAIARGVHIGPTPIGYMREKSKPLIPHPDTGPIITELFDRAASGKYLGAELGRWATERLQRPCTPTVVRRWLASRVYLGEVAYGALRNPDAHPPLTDSATFERCQRPAGVQRPAKGFLLAGLVRCAGCRYSMGGQTFGGAKGQTPIYRCSGRMGCEAPAVIVAERLERFVVADVREQVRGLTLQGVPSASDLGAVEGRLADAQAELGAFASDLDARRLLGEAGWREALEVRALERDRLATERKRILTEQAVETLTLSAESLEGHELRDLLTGMLRYVFVRKGRAPVEDRALLIYYRDEAIDVPGSAKGPFGRVDW